MNLKINRETVKSDEKICGCTQEQPVELDYVLPDYYPEIFRIVKCMAEPKITSCTAGDNRITYELTVCLKIIYCSEGSSKPQVVDQKLTYTRNVNLDKSCEFPAVYVSASADHINCRAVNHRRIDIRGAVTVRISAYGICETEVVSDVYGGDVQLKRKSCMCPSSIIRTQKRVSVSDEFELGADAAPIGSVIRCCAEIVSSDRKIIGSKAAAKGELKISLVYTPSLTSEDGSDICTMTFSMPFSNLAELEGMDDTYDCRTAAEVISCDIIPRSDADGEIHSVECEVTLLIDCEAVRNTVCELACDEYSVSCNSAHTGVPVRICKEPVSTDGTVIVKGICESKDSPLSVIYDAWCSTDKLSAVITDGKPVISGNVLFTVMGKAENGDLVICETDVPVEESAEAFSGNDSMSFGNEADIRMQFNVLSCGYTITADNTAEVKAEISARGVISDYETVEAISEISVDEDSPRENMGDYAVRLYFADEGEEIWGIAKKYGAAIDRITEENELDGDVLKESRMLLIPVA